jgi:alkylresorcinol/alkylpyrone synthase
VSELGSDAEIDRVPLYQHGCAGGAAGLALASRLAPAYVASVELCSLVFQSEDLRGGNVVGSALFGDGAACAAITDADNGLVFRDTRSWVLPESTHLMGYELLNDGAHLTLDRELPSVLADFAPDAIRAFVARSGLSTRDIQWWLFHPGGTKILNILEQCFELRRTQTHWSWDVLARYGNMSSATILFVLAEFMKDAPCADGDFVLVAGIGPGLVLQLLLLQWIDQ